MGTLREPAGLERIDSLSCLIKGKNSKIPYAKQKTGPFTLWKFPCPLYEKISSFLDPPTLDEFFDHMGMRVRGNAIARRVRPIWGAAR